MEENIDNDLIFAVEEYRTLRKEVENTKANIFRTISFGLTGVPGLYFFSQQFDVQEITVPLPFVVLVIGYMYLSENHALMRCGKYIRENLEPLFGHQPGWENWISNDERKNRSVDRLLHFAFFAVFIIYFGLTSYIGVHYIREAYSPELSKLGLFTYAGVGAIFLLFFILNLRTSTSTK